jgi:hypothetical protein
VRWGVPEPVASCLLVALLVLAALTPSLALAQPAEELVRGEPDLEIAVSNNRFAPGETGEFAVDVLNEGEVNRTNDSNLDARVTTARAVSAELEPFDAPLTVETEERGLGAIADGQSAPATFTVRVDEDAEPGRYIVPVEVTYTYTEVIFANGTYVDDTDSDTLFASVVVDEQARFRVVDVDSSLAAGESGPLLVTMRNDGSGTARDANVELATTNEAFSFDGAPRAASYGGDWDPGETRTFDYRASLAPDAPERSYAIDATVRYEDEDGRPQESEPVRFGVVPGVERSFAVENVSSTLRVGQEGTVEGSVRNTGDLSSPAVVARLETGNPNVAPVEPEVALGSLDPGERASFSFDVDVSDSAGAGPRQFDVVVGYRDRDGGRSEVDPIPVAAPIGPLQDEFVVRPVEATFAPGESGELRLNVTNTRDEPLRDVSAKLFPEEPVTSSDDEAFVPVLAPGESTEIVFGVDVAGSAIEKTYPAGLDFRYEDDDGETRLSSTYQVPVTVADPPADGPPWTLVGLAVIGLIAVAAGLVLLGRRRRRRRERRPRGAG